MRLIKATYLIMLLALLFVICVTAIPSGQESGNSKRQSEEKKKAIEDSKKKFDAEHDPKQPLHFPGHTSRPHSYAERVEYDDDDTKDTTAHDYVRSPPRRNSNNQRGGHRH